MQRGRVFERKEVASHSSAIIVDHGGEPRLGSRAVGTEQQNVERGVIGLPDRVGPIGFPPVYQLECVAIRFRPVMGERDQIGGQRGDDAIDEPIARWLLSQILCEPSCLTADRCNWQRWLLEGDAFDGLLELLRNLAALASVGSFLSCEGGQAKLPIQRHPALSGSERDSRRRHDRLQRAVILQVRLKEAEPIKGELSGLFRESRQLVHTRRVRQIACKLLRQII